MKKKIKNLYFKKKISIASIYFFLYTDLLMLVVIYTDRGINTADYDRMAYITSTDRGIITQRGHLSTDRGILTPRIITVWLILHQ